MSEVRKAQTYGRDPRNGHSTIYCISKAGTIYQASEPMYELLMQNMRALEQVGRGETCDRRDDSPTKADAGPARRQPRAERSRACSSRPCVVVGAEPAVHRRGRGSDHAAPGRPPRPTSPLRRRSPRRSRHSRRASACFRRSVPHRPSWTWLRAALHRPDDGAVAHPAAGCAAAVDSLAPDVAAASEGCAAPLLGLTPSTCGGGGCGVLPPRRLRGQPLTGWPRWRSCSTRSWPWGSPTLDASKTRMI